MYKTINGWTKKSMAEHIKKEFTGKAMDSANNCMYRGSGGTKCAAGMFIPDELYNPIMETNCCSSNKLDSVKASFPLAGGGMNELQQCHDNSNPDTTLDEMFAWINDNVEA